MARGKKRGETTPLSSPPPPKKQTKSPPPPPTADANANADDKFLGDPVPADLAQSKWPHRYQSKKEIAKVTITLSDGTTEDKEFFQAKCHYEKAVVDGIKYDLFDDVYVKASDTEPDYIGKVVEMYENVNKEAYVCVRWFYRAKDTVIKDQDNLIHKKRVFVSEVQDDNPLSCIMSKVKIAELALNMDSAEKEKILESFDLYVDMMYTFPPAFTNYIAKTDTQTPSAESGKMEVSDGAKTLAYTQRSETTLLDLYSGCGAMSSGLSIGALLTGENVVTRWAVDFNSYACESLRFNHPNTQVRNEDAEDFFVLLKEWQNLCKKFNLLGSTEIDFEPKDSDSDASDVVDGTVNSPGEYEVEKLIAVCYGDPKELKKRDLYFKVRWKGYGSADDTWEPIDGLSNCEEKIKEFVAKGHRTRMLPLPGDVDVICGGPPCQGISGYNRFRESCDPLKDPKNRQLVTFMNIVDFLKPRYVLMENVTDILKFAEGLLGSYAVGRLVSMNYQARLGIMAAGSYGVPQCRMRFFLWGAGPNESLPQFPLPTHEFLKKGVVTNEFKELIVGQDDEKNNLLKAVLLGEAISDFPQVTNYANQDEMPYGGTYKTPFQKFIRLKRHEIFGYKDAKGKDPHNSLLYDHRPLQLNEDDYERVCLIPKVKGANFRDLPGVIVEGKVAKLDPSVQRVFCKSGKPLVPDYAISFKNGKSTKPFGRLGMDDVISTVVTRAEPHNQVVLHPDQDRVLSVRENARLQGFPDCYKLFGSIKERYMQIGNAVSFSASIPLGYCLGKAMRGENYAAPLSLPFKFPDCLGLVKSARQEIEE